ncbi:hypothetical protein F0562_014017 [Nyssa sinensis]|uniref:Uncharacterized protein n=1 Tax=Nyssa sinensis TaxID=561372 RepID=A0A5J4ZRQ3_9ASTE|nr:hypothetical protein F0562_014017 [Nyssa sinensis]
MCGLEKNMASFWLFVTMLVLANGWWCFGCWEQERVALLQLKADINFPNGTSLTHWVDKATVDCCFEILSRLSNLQVLDLGYNDFDCGILPSLSGVSSLKSLYLGYNFIMTSSTHMNCVQNLSSMSNLEVLDLSSNYFNNSILSFLNAWPSLKILNLGGNRLNGTIHIQDFDGLNNLKELDLSFNDLKGIITKQGIERVPWLNSLEALDLSNNLFSNGIWSFLSRLSSLKTLFLTRNYELKGTSYSEGIKGLTSLKVLSLQQCLCELRNLQELNLYDNMLEGNLPRCLENLTSLRYLDVSSNHFTGNIALSPLTKLTSLEYLALSYNLFQISISFGSFFNHSNLKVIESLDNKVVVETEFQTLAPSFQLIGIRLSNSNLGNSIAGFPSFLYYQHDLRKVELSQVVSNEKFPNWLLENNTKLSSLLLPNNSLSGPLQLPSHPIPKLLALDISNNHLDGNISNNIGTTFPSLAYLNLSTNAFGGNIPTSVGDMHYLLFLDLSNNQLFGGIPEQLALGCYLLRFLNLSNNKLKGPILPTSNNLTRLNYLYLEHNHFTKILDTLSNCSNLWYLFIGHNNLSGSSVPRWMGNMSSLIVLSMPNNYLEGLIPVEFCQFNMLQVLDLSENNIGGTLPSCFKPQLIIVVQLSGNRLQGPLSRALYNSSFLEMLDLSNNHLTGRIPHWIGSLSHLEILLLRNNHFEGEVPIQVCYLSDLRLIDLSQNNLSGNIPPCINNITFKEGPTDIYSDAALLPFFKLTAFFSESDYGLIDMDTFYVSFTTSYITVLLAITTILCINPHWRRAWFYLIEVCINSCYYFVMDNLPKIKGIFMWK